jgi:phosphoribosylanthranilate isomerase
VSRTRIKICGITREEDLRAAVDCGADALGFVFYEASPRFVSPQRAAELVRQLPPFVSAVGLFVDGGQAFIASTLQTVPLDLLQFHGDEPAAECRRYQRPYIKAARVRLELDLVEYAALFPDARGLLLDAFVEGYGGGGKGFDWSLIPPAMPLPLILAGGLDEHNVGQAIERVRPWAVDVSSGVEAAKGIKDAARMARFVAGVRNADNRHPLV